jgi:hypothetical protein
MGKCPLCPGGYAHTQSRHNIKGNNIFMFLRSWWVAERETQQPQKLKDDCVATIMSYNA